MAKRLFKPGITNMTQGVFDATNEHPGFTAFCCLCLARHLTGDWGDVCREDWESNDAAVNGGDRLVSVYNNEKNPDLKIWIITEWDRSATTILFPSEY